MKYYVKSSLSENIHETPEGFLLCIGVPIARTGEMLYGEGETPLETDDEGKILIHREEEEVFSPKTIASFEGKAVTISHPNEFVNPDNWKILAKGIMQNVRRGSGENKNDLIADLLITDSVAINLVKSGLREVSCGYEAEYTQTGEGRGLQTNIIGNHLALVDQGRAGSSYAINDHKAKGIGMKLQDKIKAIFARAQDEAMKVADESAPEEKKDDKAKDEFEKKPEGKKDDEKADKSKDEMGASYDELVKMVKDLGEKLGSMAAGKQKDASTEPSENEPAEVKADDADPMAALEERLKALEASVAKLLSMEAEEQTGDESDLITDEDGDGDEEESEDDDFEESTMTGDAASDIASRVEILAPGLKANQKDVKVKAIKVAYGTAEGKKVIDSLTGGKAPTYDSAEKIETLFIAASELLKVSRSSDLSKTKQTRDSEEAKPSGAMTAEQMNEFNAKHYARK